MSVLQKVKNSSCSVRFRPCSVGSDSWTAIAAMAEPTSPKTLTIDGTRQLSKLSAERMERQSSKHGMDCRPPSLRMTALTMERSISNLSQLPGLRKPFRIDLLRAEFRQIGYIRLAEQKFAARVSGR